MSKHIRYVIDGFTTQRVENVKALGKALINLDDEIKVSKSGYKVSISFRTPDDARILGCEELDELLSKFGVTAMRIIAMSVSTYEYEGAVSGDVAGGVTAGVSTKRLDTALLIAVLSGLGGCVIGKTIEKGEGIIESCEKRNGRWARVQ
ncbi:hypothetical protein [Metallosphaera hakonensis]|uniref:Uncharacterized protein n=1 Tax=Metallosphaera hakonensis JCM 8857 = DSM 7519 TaxID=1293036 RepID=A0A2U9IV03_9CREN|nr:hypothetical protein [Metallosphaera hakonensis]AWR99921.1 hypothetical protein DFR87_09750 [Metallosphaera hakonensis JCM 8857 = DSM 7519]